MALSAIRANKLRSTLTLLGIVVGVFSIIAVMTAMGVLRSSIEEGLAGLGANTFRIQNPTSCLTARRSNDEYGEKERTLHSKRQSMLPLM